MKNAAGTWVGATPAAAAAAEIRQAKEEKLLLLLAACPELRVFVNTFPLEMQWLVQQGGGGRITCSSSTRDKNCKREKVLAVVVILL